VSDHNHPEIDDRITAEMALVRTEIAGVAARVDVLRQDMRRGFTEVMQVLGQIVTRLPDQPDT
jgi:phosphoglycerate-specific signal transduction histidine kinase